MTSNEHNIEYTQKALPSGLIKIGLLLFLVGLITAVAGYFTDPTRSAFNNLILLMFMSSVGVGSLFLVSIEYVSGAVWSTPFRRITEFLGAVLFVLPLIALPLFFNIHDIFHWTHTEEVVKDEVLKGKSGYLNQNFFIIRNIIYVAVWIVFYLIIIKNSRKQDLSRDQLLTKKNIRLSAIFIPFFAITVTFASIDWIMSLEPHWFSTIFGVYYFSGTILAALAITTFLAVLLNEKGYFVKGIKSDHYYSLGAMLFAFTNFWAYIAFSQFLLIYYANLPEETFWFINRWEGSWMYVSLFLILVHFLIPYFGLLSQPSKMNPKRLKIMSIFILFAHMVDLYWLIMPTYSREGIVFGWMEIGYPLLAFGLVILVFSYVSKNKNLVPIGDPKLRRGLDFRL
jgi:hypothetical protein